jgi:EAL domain-containing protein (putative c-di-GMP-specific phosphodiesterase class I)
LRKDGISFTFLRSTETPVLIFGLGGMSQHSQNSAAQQASLIGADRDLLLELGRLRKSARGLRAVHILSSIVAGRPRFENDLAAANHTILGVLTSGAQYKIFNLSNGDIVFIYSQVTSSAMLGLCTGLETALFVGVDARRNVYGEMGNYKIFDLAREIQQLIDGIRVTLSGERKVAVAKQPIDSKQSDAICEKIRASNIRSIVFNQPIYNIEHEKTSIEFLEFFTSIKNLEQLMVPDRSIAANPWLFNIIKRELDAAVMRAIGNEIPEYRHKAFSLNLLVESFMSDAFREFIGSLPVKLGGRIFVELEKTDVVQHSEFLKDILERGKALQVPLCIDGVSHHDVPLLRMSRLQFDYLKLKWAAEIPKGNPDDMEALVWDIRGCTSKVILTRCDSQKSLAFARAVGVKFVQGYLADEQFRMG